jgi:copper(I)-binding protein
MNWTTTSLLPGRRALLRAGGAVAIGLALPPARACEFFSTHLRIYHPWSRATAEGDAFAVLCMRFDEVRSPDRLIRVETPVATGAEMNGPARGRAVDIAIPAGRETELSETGTFIRLTGLKHPLEVGRNYPLKLVFAHGGVVDADIDIDFERASPPVTGASSALPSMT